MEKQCNILLKSTQRNITVLTSVLMSRLAIGDLNKNDDTPACFLLQPDSNVKQTEPLLFPHQKPLQGFKSTSQGRHDTCCDRRLRLHFQMIYDLKKRSHPFYTHLESRKPISTAQAVVLWFSCCRYRMCHQNTEMCSKCPASFLSSGLIFPHLSYRMSKQGHKKSC